MSFANTVPAVSVPSPQGWDPVEWLKQFWNFYVGLWPDMLGLEHQFATIVATTQSGTLENTTARQGLNAVSELMKIQTWTQKQVETYGSELGLGIVGVAIVSGTIAASIVALVYYSVQKYNALRQVVDSINAGTLTPTQATNLLNAAGKAPAFGGLLSGLGGLLLVGLGAVVFLHMRRSRPAVVELRENPDLMLLGANPPDEDELGVWSHRVLSVDYIHDDDGEPYTHAFSRGVRMQGRPDGSVRLFNPRRAVWREF